MMVLFDANHDRERLTGGTRWRPVTDQVMGGVSSARLKTELLKGRHCLRLIANVSTANNGGFAQMAADVTDRGVSDWSGYEALALDVFGNGEQYSVHLRTTDLSAPWQSYRAHFVAPLEWTRVVLSLDAFTPHRTNHLFDASRVRRLGIVAIGRDFDADIAVARIELIPLPV